MAHFLCMAWSSDPQFCVTHCAGVPLVTHAKFWWSGPNCGPQKWWIPWASHWKSSMWHLWLATLVSENWLMHYSKGFGGPSCMRQWLPLFVHALVHKQKTVLQSLLVYCSPFQSQNLASLHGALILPLIYHSLMDVTQFSLVWITSQNTQFSFLVRWVIRHWLQLRQCSCSYICCEMFQSSLNNYKWQRPTFCSIVLEIALETPGYKNTSFHCLPSIKWWINWIPI